MFERGVEREKKFGLAGRMQELKLSIRAITMPKAGKPLRRSRVRESFTTFARCYKFI